MKHLIDKDRLRSLRENRRLTQEMLAQRAKLNKQTVYRIESGSSDKVRTSSLEALAKALGTKVDVLTGSAPLPPEEMSAKQERVQGIHKLKDPIDGRVRNAYTLVSQRYGVSTASIVELAPLMFLLLAEKSLQRRRANLEQLKSHLKSANDMAPMFAHVEAAIVPGDRCADALAEEASSIEANDVLAEQVDGGYCEDDENPFVRYLQEFAEGLPTSIELDAFSAHRTRYEVCLSDVRSLTANNELLTKLLTDGDIPLHEMPRDLLPLNKVEQRLEWFKNYLVERVRDGWTPPIRIPLSVLDSESREELCDWFRSKLDESKADAIKQHRAIAPLSVVSSKSDSGGKNE